MNSEQLVMDEDPRAAQAQRLEQIDEQFAILLQQANTRREPHQLSTENEWSAIQTMGHIAEMIPYWLSQCQPLITATGELPHFGRQLDDPERLAGVKQGASWSLAEAVQQVSAALCAGAQVMRDMPMAARDKCGIHSRYGEVSVAEIIERTIVTHAEEHLAQVKVALGE